MVNKIMGAFMAADGLFAITGAIMMGFSVTVLNTCFDPPTEGEGAARDLLYRRFPLQAGIANAVMVFVNFALTLPALATPARGLLKTAGYMIAINAVFSLIIGLDLWITTLKTKQEFSEIWISQTPEVQSLLQTRFQCCGYFNSTSPAFTNVFVDNIFTAVFAFVGIDVLLILATACLMKDRKERERFRHIDEKSGVRQF
ncbi:hypothetical protein PG997_004923 [Apiospora hydei]|uniref:Tetraspanin n=1 Tax=Apiospora hydei TaxID=1337664 RepID=A0ABR1X3H5_9PEZI